MLEKLQKLLAKDDVDTVFDEIYDVLKQCADISLLSNEEKQKLFSLSDDCGYNLLHFAILNCENAVVAMLIKHGASYINCENIYEETALDTALDRGNLEVVAMLIKLGVVVNEHYTNAWSAASYSRHPEDLGMLIVDKMLRSWEAPFNTHEIKDISSLTYDHILRAYTYLIAEARQKNNLPADVKFIVNYMNLGLDCDTPILEALFYAGNFRKIPKYFEEMKRSTSGLSDDGIKQYIDVQTEGFVNKFNAKFGVPTPEPEAPSACIRYTAIALASMVAVVGVLVGSAMQR